MEFPLMNRTDLIIALITVAIAFKALLLITAPDHQRCTPTQLESIGRAGGILRPGTCDSFQSYLHAYPTNTPLSMVADYVQN